MAAVEVVSATPAHPEETKGESIKPEETPAVETTATLPGAELEADEQKETEKEPPASAERTPETPVAKTETKEVVAEEETEAPPAAEDSVEEEKKEEQSTPKVEPEPAQEETKEETADAVEVAKEPTTETPAEEAPAAEEEKPVEAEQKGEKTDE